MDQNELVDAIGKHMDRLESYVNAIVLLAVAAGWAGVRRSREIEAFGTKFDRRHAFWALSVLYLIANVVILIAFLRIGDLLTLVDDDKDKVLQAATRIATHSWVLNPFAYFGGSLAASLYAAEGWGLLVVTWWLCNTSLATLMDNKRSRAAWAILAIFLLIGLASMLAIRSAQSTLFLKIWRVAPELNAEIVSGRPVRIVGTLLGSVIGPLIFLGANRLQERLARASREMRPGDDSKSRAAAG